MKLNIVVEMVGKSQINCNYILYLATPLDRYPKAQFDHYKHAFNSTFIFSVWKDKLYDVMDNSKLL